MKPPFPLRSCIDCGVGVAVAAVFAASLSAGASADDNVREASPPIHIERCAAVSRSVLNDPFNGLRQEYVTGVLLRYVNDRPQPANLVEIKIRYEHSSVTIVDRGSFGAGIVIERSLPAFAGRFSGGSAAQCSVANVTFANGEAWNAQNGWHSTTAGTAGLH